MTKSNQNSKNKIIAISVSVLFVLLLSILVRGQNILTNFDSQISFAVLNLRSPALTTFFKLITDLGDVKTVLLISIIPVIIFIKQKHFAFLFGFLISVLGSEACTYLIKHIVERNRPFGIAFVTENSFSFPSAHATTAIALFGFLIYCFWSISKKYYQKKIALICGTVLIVLIGFSRLYLGVHFLTDVLAGYSIGFIWLISGMMITEKLLGSKVDKSPRL